MFEIILLWHGEYSTENFDKINYSRLMNAKKLNYGNRINFQL